MGELSKATREYVAERKMQDKARQVREEQESAIHEAQRLVAHERAVEFTDLLKLNDVEPRVNLATGSMQIIALGWIVFHNFEHIYDQSTSLFVSHDASITSFCGSPFRKDDKLIVQTSNESGVSADRILAEEWALGALARRLAELNIVD